LSSYADTSFLVSLYILDVNSVPAANFMRHVRLPLLLTPLGELELAIALQLRVFRKELTPPEIKAASALFRKDLEAGILSLKPLSASTYERARQIARRRTAHLGTRTLDILHVAAALLLQADTFYTFDHDQRRLAKAEGLKVP
jgi:predicted nucleic acid-binding protein